MTMSRGNVTQALADFLFCGLENVLNTVRAELHYLFIPLSMDRWDSLTLQCARNNVLERTMIFLRLENQMISGRNSCEFFGGLKGEYIFVYTVRRDRVYYVSVKISITFAKLSVFRRGECFNVSRHIWRESFYNFEIKLLASF